MNKEDLYNKMDEAKINAIFKAKAKSSFKTKMTFFLYSLAKKGETAIEETAFLDFKLENETDLIKEYTTEYVQEYREHIVPNSKYTIEQIYQNITRLSKQNIVKDLETKYVANYEKVFPYVAFKKNLEKESCFYCDITIKEIEELIDARKIYKKANRGFNHEVERFNSNLEYTAKNCDMACYWCNNAKTDEFTKDEFKEIAKGIRKVWDKRK